MDISGWIVLGKQNASVRDAIYVLSKGHKQIVLNLDAIDFIGTTDLGSLVGAFTTVRKHAGDLKLFNLQDKVTYVMLLYIVPTSQMARLLLRWILFCKSISSARA